MFNKSRQASAVRDRVTVTGQPLHSNLKLQLKHISSATAILLTLHIGAFHAFLVSPSGFCVVGVCFTSSVRLFLSENHAT